MANEKAVIKFDAKYYDFLDELRESGKTNMFGARPYLEREFGLDKKKATEILSDWMATFGKREGGAE